MMPRRSHTLRPQPRPGAAPSRLLLIALALVFSLAALPAAAQQRYEMQDDGSFQPVDTEAPEPGSPEANLQAIRRALAEDRPADAERLADRWIDQFDEHPRIAEAHLLRGDARMARQHYYNALFDYEFLIRAYPESEYFFIALEREYEIARLFTSGVRRRIFGLRLLPAHSEGEEILIRIQERAPGSDIGESASLTLADYYYGRRRWALAAEAYNLFLLNYPRSPQAERALRRAIEANLARYRGPEYDPTGLIEAGQRLEDYQQRFPDAAEQINADQLHERIHEQRARKELELASWYIRRGEQVSAAYLYQRVAADFPGTDAATRAQQRLDELDLPVLPEVEPGDVDEQPAAPDPADLAPRQPQPGSQPPAPQEPAP